MTVYKIFRRLLTLLVLVLPLSACVYTGAEFFAEPTVSPPVGTTVRNSGEIVISEEDSTNRAYQVIGTVSAYGRSFNLLSPDPTRDDVNEALRVEAAKQGADAVLNVRYHSERTGLASRGKMIGSGVAVIYTAP